MDHHDLLVAVRSGAPIIVPTDTVYGVAIDPSVTGATQRLFDLKERPLSKALPVLGASLSSLQRVALFDERAAELAARFWPGPLTLVLPRYPGWSWDLGGEDQTTVAVRVPAHPLTQELLELAGPLAVTSANLSGQPAAVDAASASRNLGPDVPVLDGGPAQGGTESTVLSLVGEPSILRAGAVPAGKLL